MAKRSASTRTLIGLRPSSSRRRHRIAKRSSSSPRLSAASRASRCPTSQRRGCGAPWPSCALPPRLPLMRRWAGISGAAYGAHFKHDLLRPLLFRRSDGPDVGDRVAVHARVDERSQCRLPGRWFEGDHRRHRGEVFGAWRTPAPQREGRRDSHRERGGGRRAHWQTATRSWPIGSPPAPTVTPRSTNCLEEGSGTRRWTTVLRRHRAFPSYVQVSLGVAQDLADTAGLRVACRRCTAGTPIRGRRSTPSAFVSSIFDPDLRPAGKTAVTLLSADLQFRLLDRFCGATTHHVRSRKSSGWPMRSLTSWNAGCPASATGSTQPTSPPRQASSVHRQLERPHGGWS